jgi:hypothetical protein
MTTKTFKPQKAEMPNTAGYPQTDIGRAGTWTKGKFAPGVGQKEYSTMRGAGAATKGTKFLKNVALSK